MQKMCREYSSLNFCSKLTAKKLRLLSEKILKAVFFYREKNDSEGFFRMSTYKLIAEPLNERRCSFDEEKNGMLRSKCSLCHSFQHFNSNLIFCLFAFVETLHFLYHIISHSLRFVSCAACNMGSKYCIRTPK